LTDTEEPRCRTRVSGHAGAVQSASERGTVAPGSIDGSLSRGWCRHRRCFPLHPPRSWTSPSSARRYDLRRLAAPAKLRNTRDPVGAENPVTSRDQHVLVDA
jgi:hypothetical protein